MANQQLDRFSLRMKSLEERRNRLFVQRDFLTPATPAHLDQKGVVFVKECADAIRQARRRQRPVILAFGAHTIKNGLGPILICMMQGGWLTHLATNGAGIIHDWEFAFQGASGEHVAENVACGEFGNWEETGFYINLALNIGAYEGRGYGESVGALIEEQQLDIPSCSFLREQVANSVENEPDRAAAAAELLTVLSQHNISPGVLRVAHPYKYSSVQAVAFKMKVPFTGHPMFGHDIIYNHPMNNGALLGRAAQRDFLTFAAGVSQLQDGVYISIGSAVMSPMIFEKALSMGQNLALQNQTHISGHSIFVVDLAQADWDWSKGEPPESHPAYYQRYNKSFSRMGGKLRYLSADNRNFLLGLCQELNQG